MGPSAFPSRVPAFLGLGRLAFRRPPATGDERRAGSSQVPADGGGRSALVGRRAGVVLGRSSSSACVTFDACQPLGSCSLSFLPLKRCDWAVGKAPMTADGPIVRTDHAMHPLSPHS